LLKLVNAFDEPLHFSSFRFGGHGDIGLSFNGRSTLEANLRPMIGELAERFCRNAAASKGNLAVHKKGRLGGAGA
jgi:hypothetical protein